MSNCKASRDQVAHSPREARSDGRTPDVSDICDSDSQSATGPERRGRVLIIVENLSVPFDRRVWSEAISLLRNGYDVSVICPKDKKAQRSFEIIEGIHIYRHWVPQEVSGIAGYLIEYGAALFLEFILSVRVLLTRGFDVIHGCNPPDTIFVIGGFYKLAFGKRFIFDHHDLNPELYEAKFRRRGFLWRLQILLERWTFRSADVSIATNESFRSVAIARGGMSPDRAFVVRTGPNLTRVRLLPPDEEWKMGRKFMVAYVGMIGNQDGLELLIDAVLHIRAQRKRDDVQFVIVGDGPELESIMKLASSAELDDVMTFVGRVEDDRKLFTILSTADVCLNPDRPNSVNDKSTTIKIMEYMALGKPIVQFDLTEGRNSAGDASLYARNDDTADFGDKVLELLDDPEKSRRMGELGQRRVREVLAWEHEEKKLLAAYETAFAGLDCVRESHDVAKSAKRTCPDISSGSNQDRARNVTGIRVCMLAYTFYEADNRVRRYAEALVKRGDQVDAISLARENLPAFEVIQGVRVFRIQKRVIDEKGPLSYLLKLLLFFVRSAWILTVMHLRDPYDVIHVHSVPDFEVFATLIPRLMGARVILDIHDLVPEFYASKFRVSKRSLVFRQLIVLEKLSIAFSSHVIISNDLWYEKLIRRSVSPEKCVSITNYPDLSIFWRRPRPVSPNGDFVMCYPGTLNWHQGLDVAIDAMSLLRERAPDLKFHIVGDGPDREKLIGMVSQLHLEDRVTLQGFVPMEQVAEIMSRIDLGVVPKRKDSFGNEAFSTKILEFMAMNVPVVASRTRIDEYYFSDRMVQFFESDNAEDLAVKILDLMENPDRRIAL